MESRAVDALVIGSAAAVRTASFDDFYRAQFPRLVPLASYSAYATAFRYPTPGGRIPADPSADTIRRDLVVVRDLIVRARDELLPEKMS